jgi:two-component system, LytTR family, sensor kinase
MNLFNRATFLWQFAVLLLLLCAVHFYINVHVALLTDTMTIVEVVCSGIILFFLCYIQSTILAYYAPSSRKQLYVLAWGIVLACIYAALLYGCMYTYFKQDLLYLRMYEQTLAIRILIATLCIYAVGMYNLQWEAKQYELSVIDREMQLAEIAKEAELFKLRQQIQPHFLFNSLNSINALIGIDTNEARSMVLKLSDFLRATLKREEKELITLQQELAFIKLYFEIEQVRFGDRLSYIVQVPDTLLNCTLPNLLLQPLIENAIKHGLYNSIEEVCITLQATLQNNVLLLQVSNPFEDGGTDSRLGTGFGLASTRKRLQLVYSSPAKVEVLQHKNVFTVKLSIPQ